MVCDSLHIICGNCGSLLTIGNENNQKASASIDKDYKGDFEDVSIACNNCHTLHFLSKYMEISDEAKEQ